MVFLCFALIYVILERLLFGQLFMQITKLIISYKGKNQPLFKLFGIYSEIQFFETFKVWLRML
ncbi:hypothetical protein DW143_17860 [Bacillus sonorensis]|nr:hypothetical protein DW143_17860 [Bacillus sonorensis]